MLFIFIIRLVIWLTFFLLIVEGVAALIIIRRFYHLYIRKHIELESRVAAVERHVNAPEQPKGQEHGDTH